MIWLIYNHKDIKCIPVIKYICHECYYRKEFNLLFKFCHHFNRVFPSLCIYLLKTVNLKKNQKLYRNEKKDDPI